VTVTQLPLGTPSTLSLRVAGASTILATLPVDDAARFREIISPSIRFEGFVDGIHHGKILGWVRDQLAPTRRLSVVLKDGGADLFTVLAEKHRADLERAGKGDGRHGFEVPLPLSVFDGRSHALRLRIEGTDLELGAEPLVVGPERAAAPLADVVPPEILRHALGRNKE
jgi:hypothetical protein